MTGGERWRTGRKVGRTLYIQAGDEPSDDDVLIGVMDTPELAAAAVAFFNTRPGQLADCGRCRYRGSFININDACERHGDREAW